VDLTALRPEGADEVDELVREEMEKLNAEGGDPNAPISAEPDAAATAADPASPTIPAAPE
jgi:hypothetical protein